MATYVQHPEIKEGGCKGTQSGNALFLILVAVVLFAALSFVVTRSTRSGGNLGQEQINLGVSRFLSYVSQMRLATTRLQLAGIDVLVMDFSKPSISKAEFLADAAPSIRQVNSDCHSDQCKVFSPNGGGAIPILGFQEYAPTDWATTVCSSIVGVAAGGGYIIPVVWSGAGSALSDVVMRFECLAPAFCSTLQSATRTSSTSSTGTLRVPTVNTPSRYSTYFAANDASSPWALPNAISDDPNGSGVLAVTSSTHCVIYVLLSAR